MVKYDDLLNGMRKITYDSYRKSMSSSSPNFIVKQRSNPIYYAGTKLMRFIGQVASDKINVKKSHMSTYTRPSYYNVEIDFKGVKPESGLNPQEIALGHLPRPSLRENDIMVRCDCYNNRFRVDFANRRVKAAAGSRPPVYHRIWPGPHLNDDTPMICKHAVSYIKWLLENGFIIE